MKHGQRCRIALWLYRTDLQYNQSKETRQANLSGNGAIFTLPTCNIQIKNELLVWMSVCVRQLDN